MWLQVVIPIEPPIKPMETNTGTQPSETRAVVIAWPWRQFGVCNNIVTATSHVQAMHLRCLL